MFKGTSAFKQFLPGPTRSIHSNAVARARKLHSPWNATPTLALTRATKFPGATADAAPEGAGATRQTGPAENAQNIRH